MGFCSLYLLKRRTSNTLRDFVGKFCIIILSFVDSVVSKFLPEEICLKSHADKGSALNLSLAM